MVRPACRRDQRAAAADPLGPGAGNLGPPRRRAFLLVGIGVGAAGTSLLVLLAKRVDERRRAPAATIVWVMMITGFVVTATSAGHFLDPFTTGRLIAVTATVSAAAFVVTLLAVHGVEAALPAGAGRGVGGAAGAPLPGGPWPSVLGARPDAEILVRQRPAVLGARSGRGLRGASRTGTVPAAAGYSVRVPSASNCAR